MSETIIERLQSLGLDYVREMSRITDHLMRARRDKSPATLTLEEWIETILLFQSSCAYCITTPFKLLDHIVPIARFGGTTQDNCVPCCGRCNTKKANHLIHGTQWDISLQEKATLVQEFIKTPHHLVNWKEISAWRATTRKAIRYLEVNEGY